MFFNSEYIIIKRDDQLLAAQLSGMATTIPLQVCDLFFIDGCLENNQNMSSNSWLKLFFPELNAFQVKQRIEQLRQSHLLIQKQKNSPFRNTVSIDEAVSFDDQVKLPKHLQININNAVERYNQQWIIWSASQRAWVSCRSEQLAVLLSISPQTPWSQVLEKYSAVCDLELLQQWLIKFVELGFLIEKKDKPTMPEATHNPTTTELLPTLTWQQLQPDHRIPVYFVPHMQNHYPLALGVLFSALQAHKNGALLQDFQLIPISFLSPQDFFNGPYRKFRTGVWLFSNYMWSLEVNMQVSKVIKAHDSGNLTIHGGPSTPSYAQACQDFMSENNSVDISVHGEGELAIVEIFETIKKTKHGQVVFDELSLQQVPGITFRSTHEPDFFRTAARKRMQTPDAVPSPYLSGHFDAYGAAVEAAIIESNRGCPFRCTFCDWGSATNQSVRQFDLDRVKQEIEWIAKQQVRVLWIADANFGIFNRDIELAKYIVEMKEQYGYPQEVVVNYTKNTTLRLVEIIKAFTEGNIISQGIISIQTTDRQTLEVIDRKNIRTAKYDELVKVFADLKLPLSTDLMMGLPGTTVEAFKNDLQHYIDMDISVKAYPTQLLPNSPMADPDYMEKYQIKTDENDFLISTFSYSEDDLRLMKVLYHVYTVADGYSLLRYIIRYLQWEHSIRAVDFLFELLNFVNQNPTRYDKITWGLRFFIGDKCMPGGWHAFYNQIADYVFAKYRIEKDSSFDTVLMVSEYSMPDDSLTYPLNRSLPHDFVAYFSARQQKGEQAAHRLRDYPPAGFHVSDPNNMAHIDMDYIQYDSHQYFWELQSDVARPKSISEFAG